MPVGIEWFAQGINRGDSMLGQKSFKLGLNQFYSVDNGRRIFGGGSRLETKLEVIEKREKIRKD